MTLWLSRFDHSSLSVLLSKVVILLLLVFLGWQLGKLVMQESTPEPALITPALFNQSQSSSKITNQNIVHKKPHLLLGKQSAQPSLTSAKSVDSSEATVSKLNLKVLGIVALSEERGVVIIQSGSKTILVATGDKIQNNVFLEAIFPDYIVITHNGRPEKLIMSSKNDLIDSGFAGSAKPMADRSDVKRLTRELKRSPMKISQYIRFQLVSRGGQVIAIKVWPKKDIELFNALGFQSGDVLQKVNGSSIATLMKTPALWQKMLNETAFEMEIDRQGSYQTVVVDLN